MNPIKITGEIDGQPIWREKQPEELLLEALEVINDKHNVEDHDCKQGEEDACGACDKE